MADITFAWDPHKNRANTRTHGVSFEEAKTIFYDDYALQFPDPDHSEDEERFLMLGLSARPRILVVCHCFRDREAVVRIISARKATKRETRYYEEHRHAG